MSSDLLFIGDPWDTLDHPQDSSLHLIRTARERFGARSFWALPQNIFLKAGALQVRVEGEIVESALHGASQVRSFRAFHSVHWRFDPPVTLETMRLWSLLAASGGERGVPFINAPAALLTWNEKFAPLRFREWAIPGLVADTEREWKTFFDETTALGRQIVAKPSADAASRGVQILPTSWPAAAAILAQLRNESGAWLVLQEYDRTLLTQGETRVFVLGQQLCGAIKKLPNEKHPIMNLDVPLDERPRLSVVETTPEQRSRALAVASALAAEGVYLATIDFIGNRILEINVTSPGLIAWLDERLPRDEQVAVKYWQGLWPVPR